MPTGSDGEKRPTDVIAKAVLVAGEASESHTSNRR